LRGGRFFQGAAHPMNAMSCLQCFKSHNLIHTAPTLAIVCRSNLSTKWCHCPKFRWLLTKRCVSSLTAHNSPLIVLAELDNALASLGDGVERDARLLQGLQLLHAIQAAGAVVLRPKLHNAPQHLHEQPRSAQRVGEIVRQRVLRGILGGQCSVDGREQGAACLWRTRSLRKGRRKSRRAAKSRRRRALRRTFCVSCTK
jgi:hypothetical protein